MEFLITLLSFFWQNNNFNLLEASLLQLSEAPIPQVSVVNEPHTIITVQTPPCKKDLSNFKEIRHGDQKKNLVALTFDDGFDPKESLQMLQTLKEKNVKATFFLKGRWIEKQKDIVDQIIADGHEMGNHSQNHADFSKISLTKAHEEITHQEKALKAHNYSPKPYFRFPYGSRTPKMLQLIHDQGYSSIMWDVDTQDWLKDSNYVKKEALSKTHNGSIILMHLGKATTAKVLPEIIDGLRKKGFTLVTVSELLNADDNLPERS